MDIENNNCRPQQIICTGPRGRVGRRIYQYSKDNQISFIPVPRDVFIQWSSKKLIQQFLNDINAGKGSIILNAAGVLDPNAPISEIEKVNVEIPKNACEVALDVGAKAMSLGTAMEQLLPTPHGNAYVASKFKLGKAAQSNWHHMRLHTLYGGTQPNSFMFLGQILNAIQSDTPFSMTSGVQYRQYHHVDDIVPKLIEIASKPGAINTTINGHESIQLRQLAISIFTAFDKLHLLHIGEIEIGQTEVFEEPALEGIMHQSRDPIPAIITYLKNCLVS